MDESGLREFAVERYWPDVTQEQLTEAVRGLRRASQQLCREGTPIRLIESILMLGDEVMLCLFSAGSEEAVREVNQRAAVPVDRIVAVVSLRGKTP